MGIDRRRLAMCSPSGVGNTHTTCHVLVGTIVLEVGHLAFGLIYMQPAVVINQCGACAVITTVFKAFKTLDEDRICLLVANISYDTTHNTDISKFTTFISAH